jgi:hypothetical protein
MLADVAKPGASQKRVGDRVEDDVGIAVTGEAAGMGDLDPAQHDRPVAAKGMDVEADPRALHQPRRKPVLCAPKSEAVVIFSSATSPSTAATLSPAARATVVSSVGVALPVQPS